MYPSVTSPTTARAATPRHRRSVIAAAMMTAALLTFMTACDTGDGGLPTAPATSVAVTIVGIGSVSSTPAGLSCSAGTCTGSFPNGTVVQLLATPGAAQRFTGWTGGCSGTGSCTLTMDQSKAVTVTFANKVEPNGLSAEINTLVPDSTIRRMEAQGFPIHRGARPPRLERIIFGSPMILLSSSVRFDTPGTRMDDVAIRFSQQDDQRLTLRTDYVAGPERGSGLSSYIVGNDSSFTVFARLTVVVNADTALATFVLSGRVRAGGVADLHAAAFVIDNRGNPSGYFIPNGTGRVLRDEDRWSPEQATLSRLQSPDVAPLVQTGIAPSGLVRGLLRRD